MELHEAIAEIADLKAQLAKETADKADISQNFKKYREGHTVEDAEHQKVIAERDTLKTEHDTLKTTVEQREAERKTKFMESKIKEMSKGDQKIADAIKSEYDILNLPDASEEEIATRLEKARTIATGGTTTSPSIDAVNGTTSSPSSIPEV